MKYLWMILVLLAVSVPAVAEDFEVTEAQYVVIQGNIGDTLGRTRITPDSIRIVVADSSGTELFDAWFESADAQCVLNGDVIVFFDQWEDINGAASIGIFNIMVTIASDGQGDVDVFTNQNYTLRGLTNTTEASGFGGSLTNLTGSLSNDQINDDVAVNSTQISGSFNAANNIETFFDDSGSQFANFDDMYDGTGYAGGTTKLDVNVASVNANALESGDFEDGFLKAAKIESDAFTAAKFATGAITADAIAANAIGASEIANAALDSATFDDDFFRAMKRFIWADTLDGIAELNSAEDRLVKLYEFFDGSNPLDSSQYSNEFWQVLARSPWRLVDTVHVDSSDIGVWLVNNLSGAAGGLDTLSTAFQNRLTATMADSVYAADTSSHNGVANSYGLILAKPSYVQGPASGLSVGDIADTLIALGVTLGDGSSACTLYVYDTGASAVVADIQIKFYNSSNIGAALGYTNSDGYQIFEMDNGTYTLSVPSNSGYVQTTNPETLVVAAGLTDTIEVTAFDPGSPTAGGTGRLYGRIHDMTGTVLEGAIVTVTIPDKFKYLTYSGIVITPFNRADTTDSNGDWSIDVYKYNVLSDTTAYYIVTANEPSSGQIIGGEIFSVGYLMPDSTQHKLAFGSDWDEDLSD